jgi:hypothetical protein
MAGQVRCKAVYFSSALLSTVLRCGASGRGSFTVADAAALFHWCNLLLQAQQLCIICVFTAAGAAAWCHWCILLLQVQQLCIIGVFDCCWCSSFVSLVYSIVAGVAAWYHWCNSLLQVQQLGIIGVSMALHQHCSMTGRSCTVRQALASGGSSNV